MIPNEIADAFSKIDVPVLVALITTLVVEYFAKPRLEARKSRLIRDRQQIDEVIFAFQKAAMLAPALLPDEYITHHPNTSAVKRRQIERLAPAVDALFDATARLPSQFIARHSWQVGAASFFVAYFAGLVWSELESERPNGDHLRAAGSDISEFDASSRHTRVFTTVRSRGSNGPSRGASCGLITKSKRRP